LYKIDAHTVQAYPHSLTAVSVRIPTKVLDSAKKKVVATLTESFSNQDLVKNVRVAKVPGGVKFTVLYDATTQQATHMLESTLAQEIGVK